MNILMFAWLFWPHIGGVEKHVEKVGKNLFKRGHKVRVFTVKHDNSLPTKDNLDGIEIYRFQKKNIERWERKRILWWLIRHQNMVRWADTVHCHDFFTFNYWYFPFRFLYPSKPVYITFHGYEEGFPLNRWYIWMRLLDTHLINGSIAIGDYITKWYRTKHDFVSYGGVEPPKEKINTAVKDCAVFVGRLKQDTGILTYVKTLHILKQRFGIHLKLEVCGEGPLRDRIEKLSKEHDLDVEIHGFVNDPGTFISKARFAFVSGYLAILEAMIRKKPVYSVYENELKRDYLLMMPDAHKMMFVSSSPIDLTKKIVDCLNGRLDVNDKVDRAFDFANKQTWGKVAKLYVRLYEKRNK